MGNPARSTDIYNTLSKRIITWAYTPGYRLTEEELCAEFEVSRSPVREALNSLVSARLVSKEAHKGYMVRLIDLREVNELYDTRLVLELAVVQTLCEKGMDIHVLKDLQERWNTLIETLPEVLALCADEDEIFHRTLCSAAGNLVMAQMLDDIAKRIHFVRLSDITDPDRMRITCQDHLDLLSALQQRDVESAKAIVRRNILWGKEKVDTAIKEALFHAHHMA
ncbi:GntR family transcriptional regulator [Sphaerochaeta globosa]|uniref:Transcriptional regulator, GntR family n=1 Tax=Sphaerochaeta globosa (strain ATCC BAA-1886 / DSM 22777 / Buddy) TaxID=158189 RepID=F0RTC7_SPHGB|nr:FCD domain-containing protein [Sphaerochaeta globosa]ADY14412.1 transcriptional regulator, GntR family [Sphaerochaeta globosa str. Buddy]